MLTHATQSTGFDIAERALPAAIQERTRLSFASVLAATMLSPVSNSLTQGSHSQQSRCEEEFRNRRRQLPAVDLLSGLGRQPRR